MRRGMASRRWLVPKKRRQCIPIGATHVRGDATVQPGTAAAYWKEMEADEGRGSARSALQ